ncbi:uncharacterized protein LOC135483399 [Lineus longissimus]|uniref:uncharacterized protein LOC135483399 n=1 Tax=Lineus longissimus TaxID=88925 RepID=UPI00315D880D
MFCQTRANSHATRSRSTTKTTDAGAALKSLKEAARPGRSRGNQRSRSLSPGSAASVVLKSPRGRGRPVAKKVTASSQKRDSSIESETISTREASKSLPRRKSRVESTTDSGRKTSRRGSQSPKGAAGARPKSRGQPQNGTNVEGRVEKDIESPKVSSGKTSPKVTLRSRLKKESPVSEVSPSTSDCEPKRKGRTAVSPSASKVTRSRSPGSLRKRLPLMKQDTGKEESEGTVTRRKSLAKDVVEADESLRKEKAKSQIKGASVSDVKSESADDKPIVKRGRGRPKGTNQKGTKRVVSSKVGAKKTQLTKAQKLAAKAKQVKRGILKKVSKNDESSASDEEDDELLAEPSVFTKLKQDVPQRKSMKVEVGSVRELKKPGRRREEEANVGGVLQGRVEKRCGRKPGVGHVTRKKAKSRELAALRVDPGSRLGERKQNTTGRLRSVSSGQAMSLQVIKKARRRGKLGLRARVRSPGSELGSDTTSQTSRGISPSSDTDTDSKKRVRKISPAARLRCPFLATRKRRSYPTRDHYNIRGPQGKFARRPNQDSEASDTATDHTLLEKNQKFSAALKRGRSGRRRERGRSSSRLDPKHSAAIDSSLSEDTSAADTEDENQLSKQFKRTEDSSMKALMADTRSVNVRRSVKSNPSLPLKRAEAAESKLSPSAQSVVTKSFSLKTIEKFKRAFKLVEPIGRSSSKDSVGSTESGGAETNTPDTKGKEGKEIVYGVKTKELPVNKKSKDLKSGRTMVAVDQKPLTAYQGISAAKPTVENTDIETVTVVEVIHESKEQVNNVTVLSEASPMPLDSDTSFRLELSTDSSTVEDLSVQNMDRTAGEMIRKETDTTLKAEARMEVNKAEIILEECAGQAEESRPDEPMEVSEQAEAELDTISKRKTVVKTKAVTAEPITVATVIEPVIAESGTIVAESKTIVPDSEAVIVEPKTVVPESETVVPESETVVPESETVVPESEPLVPESETLVPESETLVPESETLVPESDTLVPESKTAVGESKTAVQDSKTVVAESKMFAVDSDTVVAEATAVVTDLAAALVTEATVAEELKASDSKTVPAGKKTTNEIPLAEGTELETVVLESKAVVAETPVVETKTAIAESDSGDVESKNEALGTKAAVAEVMTLSVESTAVSEPKMVSSETKWEDAQTSVVAVSATSVAAGGGTEHGGEVAPRKEAVKTAVGLVEEKPSFLKLDDVQTLIGADQVSVSKDETSSMENIDILRSGDESVNAMESTAAIALNGSESAAPDEYHKKVKDDMEIVEDAIAKVVQETVQSIVHGVEEKVESLAEEVAAKKQKDEGLERPGGSGQKEQKASTSHAGDSYSGENATSRKGPIILKIKTSALWKVDADGSGTSTGSGETEETLEDTPVGDGVVVSSSQEVLEASAMSRKVKDALEEVNKTLSDVATQEVVKEDTGEEAGAAETSACPRTERLVAKEEEAVTSTAEDLQGVDKTGKHAVGDECPAVVSSKEDGVSCSCHPSGKQPEQPAEREADPVDLAAAAELGVVEEGAQAPVDPAAPPKLATASMVEVERRIEEIQAMVSDIQKQIKTGTGTSKVGPGIRSLDTEYPYGPRNIHRPDEKGDLKLTIKLGGKKGDATAAFSAGETSGLEKKGSKKHVEETKTYPKRHISPKYSDLPWVEYSESYFEDMTRKQKKSSAKSEGKQEPQIGEARPKRKPVKKTEYELYMYELKNPKRRKHKSGPTSLESGSSTITASFSTESLIDHVDARTEEKKPSNIPELLKLCKPCNVVLEDFVINLNLSALKRKQSAEGQEIHLAKRPKLTIGGGVYSKAEIDAQAIVKQLTPEKRRRSSGSRSGRRASGSSSTGSLASELESGRLSPSSPRALDVPPSRLSPKPPKRKVNRTGFPKQPKKYYYVYQCKFCPYSTNYRIAMDDHVYTHLDVVPFRCGYCNSVFGAKSGAVMHHKRNHQNLALRCIKSVDVDESQYYNYVYVTGGQHKTPVGVRSVSPSRAGGKEARNVFESIMKEIPASGADTMPDQSTAPVPIAAVAPMSSAPTRIQTHPDIPAQKIMQPAQLPTQAKPAGLAQAKPGLSQANQVKPAQILPKSPRSDKLPVYQCKFCNFSTDHRTVIETHLQHYHEEEYRFICPLCDLAFCKREETMVKHFKKWHPGKNVMFKRAPGYKDREVATSDVAISYQTAAQKSLQPDLNDAQVSNHERLLAATSAPILPATAVSATPSNMEAQNVSISSSPLLPFRKQQASGSPQSSSPGPEAGRKSNKPSITDIAANLASKVGGAPSDTSKSSNPVFLNIPNVRSRGSSPSAPERSQGAAQLPLGTGVARKPDQDVSRAPTAGGGTGILDLSRSSRESTPVPTGSNDLPAAQDDVSNLKIVNVVSLSAQASAPVPPETEEVQSNIYCCRNCKTENSSLDEIIKHIEASHSQMDFWFACPYCPYGCSKHRGNMVRHIRRAHPEKEASVVDIHLIDEAKYISKRSVTTRLSRSQNVPVIVSTGQPVPMQHFSSTGSVQMTQLAPTRGAPPLIPMVRAAGNQQRTLPPPLIRAVAMTPANSLPVSSSLPSQSMRPGSGHHMSATPPSRMQTQTGFPPPNAQVFQGVPHQGVTHMSQPGGVLGARFHINPRMAAIPSQAPKQNEDNKSTSEQEKFSVFNLRPTNRSVFPQASRMVAPIQAGVPMQYGPPGMVPQQIPFSTAPPVRGQNPGQVPYRSPQPPPS